MCTHCGADALDLIEVEHECGDHLLTFQCEECEEVEQGEWERCDCEGFYRGDHHDEA